jgi:hypothetical protein
MHKGERVIKTHRGLRIGVSDRKLTAKLLKGI